MILQLSHVDFVRHNKLCLVALPDLTLASPNFFEEAHCVKSLFPVFGTVLVLLSGCVELDPLEKPQPLSMAEVLSRPQDFDGKVITIKGWASLRHENYGIWASEAEYRKRDWKQCISLLNHYSDESKNKQLDQGVVLITGLFDQDVFHDEMGVPIVRLGTCSKLGIRFVEPNGLRKVLDLPHDLVRSGE